MKDQQNADGNPDLDTVRLIVGQINDGIDDAWQKLVGHIQGYLTLMAEKNMPAAIRAQVNPSDVVQQTMIQVVQGIDQFRGETTPEFYAWLNQILRNQSTRFARDLTRQKRDVRKQVSMNAAAEESKLQIEIPDAMHTPGTSAIAKEQLELMEQALGRLPTEYEQVIRLRSFEDRPYEDIAKEMDRSVGAVSKLWYRAMVKLQEELTSLGNESQE